LKTASIAHHVWLALLALPDFQPIATDGAGEEPFALSHKQHHCSLSIVNGFFLEYTAWLKIVNGMISLARVNASGYDLWI